MRMRVACYARVSTTSDMQDGSFQMQCEYYRKLIRDRSDWEFVGIYGDFGKSGRFVSGRSELQRLLSDCETGLIDLVLTKSVSRFARNMAECIELVRRLQSCGVAVLFEREKLDTSKMDGELILSLLAAVAAEESNSISRNLKWSRRKHAEQGRPWEKARYGYRSVGMEHRWEIVPGEAQVVRKCFVLAGMGRTYGSIAKSLTLLEEKLGSSRVWNKVPVRNMLQSRVYIGDYLSNKEIVVTDAAGKKRRRRNRGEEEQILIEGHHEPIVGKDLFDAVQELIGAGVLREDRGELDDAKKRLLQEARLIALRENAPV